MPGHGIFAEFRLRDLLLATILLTSIAAFAGVTPAIAMHPEQARTEHRPTHIVSVKVGTEFTIVSTTGRAFNLTDKDGTPLTATLHLKVKVDKTSLGRVKLTVEKGGTLTLVGSSSSSFTVDSGQGIINVHSMKVVIHVRVDDGKGHDMHLILFGHVTKLNFDNISNINFVMPQSKLAGQWFLKFDDATMTKV